MQPFTTAWMGKAARLIKEPTGGWKRAFALIGLSIGVTGGMAQAGLKPQFASNQPEPVTVRARPLSGFEKSDAGRTRFGKLEWRGGVVLSSPTAAFGGWSGLSISPDGTSLLAVSDAGAWMRGRLVYRQGRITGLKSAVMGPIRALSGQPLQRTLDRDAEAVTMQSGNHTNGVALISFEQNNRIGVFPIQKSALKKPRRYLSLPSDARSRRSKDGLESVTLLRGGRYKGGVFTVLEKGRLGDNAKSAWLLGKGATMPFYISDLKGFEITDAAGLDNGDLLLLERRFRWSEGVKMRIRRIPAGELRPKVLLKGEVLLEADMNQQIDNMEGLAAHTNSRGETILTLISDDNFNRVLQRTVMLQFALPSDKKAPAVTASSKKSRSAD